MVNMCECIILVFVNKQAFWRWQMYMLILLSQNEQGISALDLQKHIFPSGSSNIKSTFPWMQRHYVNNNKGEQLV
jgi:hypothetical protein